jgi:hypothetical protein
MAEHSSPDGLPERDEAVTSNADASSGSSDDGVFFVKLGFKGGTYPVPVQTGDAISSIFDFVLEVPEMYDFPRENCKLICKGKVFRPDDIVESDGDCKLVPGSKLMLMATSSHDATFVKKSRADPLVKGFKEEERDDRNRQKRARAAAISAWGTKQDPKFRFNSIKAEFKYNTPSPYDAEKLLQKLATDPGVIDIMKSRNFEVGILTEMSPDEAADRMSKKGTPGMDLLGYNQNAGEMIVLKLRTDNTKGFRPYHDLINTLLHEMTHNVWGPHDANFWRCFGEIKAQYMKFHRFWSHGGHTADSNSAGQFQGFAGGDEDGENADFGRVLVGVSSSLGEAPLTEKERRDRALLAAEARKVTATTGINFLSNDGKVKFACPCGQVHDVGVCPVASQADVADEEMDVEPGMMQAGEMEVESVVSQTTATGATLVENTAQEMVEVAADVEMIAQGDQGDAKVVGEEALLSRAETQPHQEFEQGLDAEMPDDGPLAGFSVEDLEALGLSGAADWLQQFTEKLQSLTSNAAQSAAREAIQLLLKLVCNIVNNPLDAKFRRIKADNPKIRSGLLAIGPEAEKLITLLGFEVTNEDAGRVFVLRGAAYDSARLQMGQDLLQRQLSNITINAH